MSARRAVWEVARRELVERSRSRVLRVSLVLLLILSVGGAVAAARLSSRTPTDDVGLVGPRSLVLGPAIRLQAKAAGRRVHLHPLTNATAAARAVRGGSIDVALLDASRILVKTSNSQPAVRVVQDAVAAQGVFDRLRSSGLTQAQALGVLAPRALPVNALVPRPRNYDRNKALIVVGLSALFLVLLFFGQAVAQGVTEEKSSRVVELLLTTLSPRRLLTGKILGVGLLGLALLFIPAAAALAAGSLAGGAGLPSAAPEAIALILLWFVLGYMFYSVAFAAVGALVSRQEDLNTAILPVTAVLTGAFYLAFFAVNSNPNGTVARVAAFLPPLSPMVVPARMVLGDMNGIGLVTSVMLEVLAIGGMIALAARAYERAILRIGAPVKLHRLFAPRSQQPHRVSATVEGTQSTKTTSSKQEGLSSGQSRLSPTADIALRLIAVVFVIAGAVVGFGKPIAIALVAAGLLLLIIDRTLKHLPRRPVH
jgi:ABC-2 type transport system permease protein